MNAYSGFRVADSTQNQCQTLFSKTLVPKNRLGLLLRSWFVPYPTRFVLPALSAFILKNDQMPLLKRINTASGGSLCQEKSAMEKRNPSVATARMLADLSGTAESRALP